MMAINKGADGLKRGVGGGKPIHEENEEDQRPQSNRQK
jgi:hypothetical protein